MSKPRGEKVTKICQRCQLPFDIFCSKLARDGRGTFCSKACQYPKSELICEYCSKSFRLKPSRINNKRGRFCSRACQHAFYTDPILLNNKLIENTRICPITGCHIWTGECCTGGYGYVVFGEQRGAHRLAYYLAYGEIPKGFEVCHSCDVWYAPGDITYRRCCNTEHMFLGTHKDNMQQMSKTGRALVGERNNQAKLTAAQVTAIRYAYNNENITQRELALKYAVTRSHISGIIRYELWKHI